MKKFGFVTTLAVAMAAMTVRAQYLELNLNSDCNQDIQTFTDGSNYALGGTQFSVNGVPFELGLLNNNPTTTGVIMTSAGNQSYTFIVPSGTYATSLYTLMNTAWGEPGQNEGSIVVTGSHGETATLDLTEGVNIRDHYNGYFVNTLSDPAVVSTYFVNQSVNPSGSVRLDRQQLVLPASFNGDTVTSITFDGADNDEPNGDPFLAAMTLAVVPEPTPYLMFGLGALVLAFGRWRASRSRGTRQ
ncbi:MAG TPA: PEP-CTERM sorting domain-containing protein [Pseudomonadales bacterium]|nr:PEP-CTERM sorting domain-containing protein [Pseudomonadales bacterium]